MTRSIRIAALISGGGSNLQAIMDSVESGFIPGKVVCVGSDQVNAGGLDRAKKHDIPTFVIDYKSDASATLESSDPVSKAEFEEIIRKQSIFPDTAQSDEIKSFILNRVRTEHALLSILESYEPDLLVLAGFMRLLSPYIIDVFNKNAEIPRIMNIHPALLPAFPGTDGYADTFNYGCKVGGCTVHFVDYGEDSGPIIGQKTFIIEPEDSLEQIKKKGLEQEWKLYPECIRYFAMDRLYIQNTHPISSDNGRPRQIIRIKSND